MNEFVRSLQFEPVDATMTSCSVFLIHTTPPPRYRSTPCSIAHIDEKNKAIKQLEEELHVRGVTVVAGVQEEVEGIQVGTEREGARIRGGASQRSPSTLRVSVERRRATGQVEQAEQRGRRCTLPHAFSSRKQLLAELSGLRSELQSVTTQVCCAAGYTRLEDGNFGTAVTVRSAVSRLELQQWEIAISSRDFKCLVRPKFYFFVR